MAERTSTVVPHNMFDRHHQRSALCRGFRAACVQAAGALVLNARDDERLLYSDPSTALELSRNRSLVSLHADLCHAGHHNATQREHRRTSGMVWRLLPACARLVAAWVVCHAHCVGCLMWGLLQPRGLEPHTSEECRRLATARGW